MFSPNVFSSAAVHFLTLEQELIAVNSSAPQSNDLLERSSCLVTDPVWEETA